MNTETANATKRDDIKKVDPRNIEIEKGFNARTDYGEILAMAHSVVEMGVLEPIIGYKKRNEDKYVLTDGHRRMEGVNLAIKFHNEGKPGFEDISKIEFIRLVPCSSDLKERLYIMAITGEGKKPLTDLEKSTMYARLIELGKSEGKKRTEVIAEIMNKVGVSRASVYNALQITELPQVIKDRIAEGVIAAGAVLAITRELKDPEQQTKAVERAIDTAAKTSESTGKKVMATAKDVKGLKSNSPLTRIKELVAKLEANGVKNVRANALIALVNGLDEKASAKVLYDLFS